MNCETDITQRYVILTMASAADPEVLIGKIYFACEYTRIVCFAACRVHHPLERINWYIVVYLYYSKLILNICIYLNIEYDY